MAGSEKEIEELREVVRARTEQRDEPRKVIDELRTVEMTLEDKREVTRTEREAARTESYKEQLGKDELKAMAKTLEDERYATRTARMRCGRNEMRRGRSYRRGAGFWLSFCRWELRYEGVWISYQGKCVRWRLRDKLRWGDRMPSW